MRIFIRDHGANACGDFDENTRRVTILSGSVLVIDLNRVPPVNIQPNYDTAKEMLENGSIERTEDGRLRVVRDISNQSPSGAAVIVTGRPGSGWKVWRLRDGRPLDVVRLHGGHVAPVSLVPVPGGAGGGGNTATSCPPDGPGPNPEPLCNANCQQPCDLNIWRNGALSFWTRVWKNKGPLVNGVPIFSAPPTVIWNTWIKRAFKAANPAGASPAPSGLTWGASIATKNAMSEILFKFYEGIYTVDVPITPERWKALLDQLNGVARAQAGLFWAGIGADVYGRSHKVASLIGKYILSTLLLSPSLTPAQDRFLNRLVADLPAVIDINTIDHIARAGYRVFHRPGCRRSWLLELYWADLLCIQSAVQKLGANRCCRSAAVYELCHIW